MSTRAAASSANSPWIRALRVLAVVAVAILFTAPTAAAATPSTLRWKTCGGAPGVQCATFRAPVDWSRPQASQVTLALTRLRATDRRRRIGSVLFNCGGPGCPSAQVMKGAPELFTRRLRERFDIVAFDPRATGESTPIRCGLPSSNPTIPLWPTDAADFRRLSNFNRRLARSCRQRTGSYLMHVGSVDVIRDMEAIRAALRDGKLNWLGLSYGTMLGALYAERYPDRIRTMALDGALDRALSDPGMLGTEATAAQDGFERWATWCESSDECPLRGQDVRKVFDDLIAEADRSPISAPAVNEGVTGQEIQSAVDESFLLFTQPNAFTETSWRALGPAIVQAQQGDASPFAKPVLGPPTNSLYGARAIACLEFPVQARNFSEFNDALTFGRLAAPDLGGATETARDLSLCYGWPKPKRDPRHFLRIEGAPPALIVNATHDPSTSYVWALNLQAQFPRSVLLTRDGDGHTSYITSPCAQAAIDRYLIDRRLPPPGTVCHD
jgi:pimeloyl-ACP methyl ester carboxylesterase